MQNYAIDYEKDSILLERKFIQGVEVEIRLSTKKEPNGEELVNKFLYEMLTD